MNYWDKRKSAKHRRAFQQHITEAIRSMVGGKAKENPKPKQNAPPLPESLPGRMCLLSYDKERERWRIVLDDEGKSSYILDDVERAIWQFRRWGYERVGCEALDISREFGAAQLILFDGRVIPVSPSLDVADRVCPQCHTNYHRTNKRTCPKCVVPLDRIRARAGVDLKFEESDQNAAGNLPSLGSMF